MVTSPDSPATTHKNESTITVTATRHPPPSIHHHAPRRHGRRHRQRNFRCALCVPPRPRRRLRHRLRVRPRARRPDVASQGDGGDGEELGFDHGAPYFTVREDEVMGVVGAWEARGLVAEWKERFGCLDVSTGGFSFIDKEDEAAKKYVGIPAMNSICKALCHEPGVEARFGITVGRMDWLQDRSSWSLSGLNGQYLGHFDGVVASDKNISSPRFACLTGRPPPLDLSLHQELAGKWQDIPVRSCFVLMLAFSEPLSSIPLRGFSFKNSDILSRAFCDSSKPGRSHVSTDNSEKWVLHSTPEYAAGVITRTGLQKLSSDTLAMVADELLHEFQTTELKIPHPFYMKAHRWGSAFPATNIGGEEKCLWDKDKNLVICGDFCASPSVEGAVLSGIRAASKILEI